MYAKGFVFGGVLRKIAEGRITTLFSYHHTGLDIL